MATSGSMAGGSSRFDGRSPTAPVARRSTSAGLAVAPGFIDLHTHSDVSLLSEPGCISAIEQGVTTQAVGLCGFSAAPVGPDEPGRAWSRRSRSSRSRASPGTGRRSAGTARRSSRARPATNVDDLRRPQQPPPVRRRQREPAADRRRAGSDGRPHRRSDRRRCAGGSRPGCRTRRDCSRRSTSWRRSPRAAAARRRPVPHPHALRTRRCRRVRSRGARDGGAQRGRAEHLAHVSARRPRARGGGRAARDCSTTPAARGLDVTFDLTVFQRGGGAWVQSLPAWARDGGQAGTAAVIRDPGVARPARRVPRRSGRRLVDGRLGRPAHLQGQPAGAGRPGRPVDRRDRPGARPGADRHRARPRARGRPVLDRSDDQEPGPPRPADRQPAVRADRRRVRPPSRSATAPTGSCPRASARSRSCSGRTSAIEACCRCRKRSGRSRPSLRGVSG